MGHAVGSRIKPLDAEIPTLQTELEVKAVDHNVTTE